MNKHERENFNVDEISKFDEYQKFEAEDFKSLELFRAKKEEYKVEEIQKQSFVNEDKTNNQTNAKKDNKVFDKLKNKIMSSSASTSASVTTAIGSTGALVCAGVLGAGIVLSPVLDLPIFPSEDESSTPEEIIIDFGNIELMNYSVETIIDDNGNSTYKVVTIYFNEQLKDEFKCYVLNKNTNESKFLDTTLDYVVFDMLNDNEYQFEVMIQNNKQEIINTDEFSLKTDGSIPYVKNHDYELLVTYNENDTFNLYYLANYDYTNNNIEVMASLIDSQGNEIISTNKNDNNVFYFENIKYQEFSLNTKGYLTENNNKFLIHNELINYESASSFDYQVNIEDKVLNLDLNGHLNENIEVKLTYLDDNFVETYTYNKDEWNGSVEIPLTKNTKDINIEINTSTFYPYSTDSNFVTYKGSINNQHSISKTMPSNISSEISLTNIEVLNDSYYNYDLKVPTTLKFDGYIYKDAYYKVFVYDSSNQLIDECENINTLNTPIYLYDLPKEETLTFKYIIYDVSNNELYTNTYQTSLALPNEYLDIENSLYMEHQNPGNITVSYNDNGTMNLYIVSNFENNSPYNAKARISLIDTDNIAKPITVSSSDKVVLIEDVDSSIMYEINYGFVIEDGIMTYAVSDCMTPSGTIGKNTNEDGNHVANIDIEETDVFKNYLVDLQRSVNSDLSVTVTFDSNQSITLTILKEEVINNKFNIDLSSYEFTSASIEITGQMDISNTNETVLSIYPTLKGNIYMPSIAYDEVYLDYGYIDFNSFNIDSKVGTDNSVIYKDIYIYMNFYMSDFFDGKIVNKSDNSYKIIDKELDYVVFTDLLAGTYEFELQIVDKNGTIYNTSSITINTEGNVPYSTNPDFDALITYNEDDDTYNFYYYPKYDHLNNKIETTYVLQDKDGNELDSNYFLGDYFVSFERIQSKEFKLLYTSTLIDGNNKYLIADVSTSLYEMDTIPISTTRISEDEIILSTENQLDSDINVIVTYKDYGTNETFTFNKDTWTGSATIKLSQLSTDVELTISTSLVIYNLNEESNIVYYMGSESKHYKFSETLSYQIDVNAQLTSVDILNNSYGYYSSTPTMLRFKGYKKPEQYLTVNVYDSSNTLIDSLSDLTNLYGVLQFNDLITTENVTFEYIIYESDKTTEVYKNTYETSLAIPSEYTSDGIIYNYFNPSSSTVTFNDDETYNAYIPINLENTSPYDVYVRVELITPFDELPYDIVYTQDSLMICENLDITLPYSTKQGVVIKDGINYYAIGDAITPSGSLISPEFENGAYSIFFSMSELSAGYYSFECVETITSDVTFKVLFDGTTEEVIVVDYADISNNIVYLDLSSYTYTTAEITLTGKVIIQYDSSIEESIDNIKGVKDYAFNESYSI